MQYLPEPYGRLVNALQEPTPLDASTGSTEANHRWSEEEVKAVVQAWASQRPLLVRGEAGVGKSQLARALAQVLRVPFIPEVIHPRYEATDLLYRDDPVKRLAKAQLLAALCPRDQENAEGWLDKQLNPSEFVSDGPLLKAMRCAEPPDTSEEHPRAVVLIDEIDKADSDLPNALLGVLGDRVVTVHPTGERIPFAPSHRPIIVVTTNEDRELPAAFIRRCAVLNLKPDDSSESEFVRWLIDRASVHTALQCFVNSPVMDAAARQVWADRSAAKAMSLPTVGLAEFLDLLYALLKVSRGDASRANDMLNHLAPYALVKHREQDQKRMPLALGAAT